MKRIIFNLLGVFLSVFLRIGPRCFFPDNLICNTCPRFPNSLKGMAEEEDIGMFRGAGG